MIGNELMLDALMNSIELCVYIRHLRLMGWYKTDLSEKLFLDIVLYTRINWLYTFLLLRVYFYVSMSLMFALKGFDTIIKG